MDWVGGALLGLMCAVIALSLLRLAGHAPRSIRGRVIERARPLEIQAGIAGLVLGVGGILVVAGMGADRQP